MGAAMGATPTFGVRPRRRKRLVAVAAAGRLREDRVAAATPIREGTAMVETTLMMPATAFDPAKLEWMWFKGGPRFDYPIDYGLAVLGARPAEGRIDFLGRWAPGAYCHFHRHAGETTTLILEGEHHTVDVSESGAVHKVRPRGHYAHAPAGDLHMEYAGPAGSLVFFSMTAPDGRVFEVLDKDRNLLNTVTIDDMVSGRLKR